MKVCPNCGFIDYSMWRQNRWRTNVEFLKMEYADTDLDPKILEELKQKGFAVDKYCAYRFSGKTSQPIIERIIIQEYNCSGPQAFHIPREHKEHRIINNRKLNDFK